MNDRIKVLLELLQMSPSEIANKLSVQRSTFSHLLSGRNKPSFDFIARFLKEFPNVNPDYLILGQKPYLRSEQKIAPTQQVPTKSSNELFETTNDPDSIDGNINTEVHESEDKVVYNCNAAIDSQGSNASTKVHATDKEVLPTPSGADKSDSEPELTLVVHHYANGTFKAYKPQ